MATYSGGEAITRTLTVSYFGAVVGNSGSPASPFYTVPVGLYAEAYLIRKVDTSNTGDLKFSENTTNNSNEYFKVLEATDIENGQDVIRMDEGDSIYRSTTGNYNGELYIFIKEFIKP